MPVRGGPARHRPDPRARPGPTRCSSPSRRPRADRLDAVVAACAAADVPCRFVRRETDLDPVAVLGAAQRHHDGGRAAASAPAADELRRPAATHAFPLAIAFLWLVRPLRLADPRPRDAVALHRRAQVHADRAQRSPRQAAAAARHHSVAASTRSTPYVIAPFWRIHDVHTALRGDQVLRRDRDDRGDLPDLPPRPHGRLAALGALRRGRRGRDPRARILRRSLIEEPLAYPSPRSASPDREGAGHAGRRWIIAAVVSALLATFVRGQLAVLIVVYALAALFLAWTSDRRRAGARPGRVGLGRLRRPRDRRDHRLQRRASARSRRPGSSRPATTATG